MDRKTRLIFLVLSIAVLIIIGRYFIGNYHFLLNDFWFTSGLLLMILLSLIDQPFYSKDSDVFVNAITAGLSLLLIPLNSRGWIYWTFISIILYLLLSSYLLMIIRNKQVLYEHRLIQFISKINGILGNPRTLFSVFFLWGIIIQFDVQSNTFNALLIYWAIFILISMPSVAEAIRRIFAKYDNKCASNAIGQIFSIQSNNIFLVKLFQDRKLKVSPYDSVEFTCTQDPQKVIKGIIIDAYLLNHDEWIKILNATEIKDTFSKENNFQKHEKDVIYKIDEIPQNGFLDKFVGLISDNSNINKIRFIYNSRVPIQEGQLLELRTAPQQSAIYYQVVNGITKIEQLEQKNESGYIVGEAITLGIWNTEKSCFEQYGWVPEINTPLFIASPVPDIKLDNGEINIGYIPGTNFPVIINKKTALTHHTAILGITGTGKSVFSRNLIREYLKDEHIKSICIDFTGEYKNKFADISMRDIIDADSQKKVFDSIDTISAELEKFPNNQDKDTIKAKSNFITSTIEEGLKKFFTSDSKLSIIELPDVSNTNGILDYTKRLFHVLFDIAKKEKCYENKVCIVIEEAHTIIPEWNFIGISDKSSQSLLNSIAQIALQGRKYDVGLLVIAQRTANVSKTILTQCNTVISFQEFDKTSSDFLSNYFGEGAAAALPNLKFRQAIAAGKALKSNIPMIFEVPNINE